MPGTPAPVGPDGPMPTFISSMLQSIKNLQKQVSGLTQGAQQTNIVDQYGNTLLVVGQLNQTVTIGAAQGQAGVQVGTALPASGKPNVGLAIQQSLVTTTITTTSGSTSATVASATGLGLGMVIGAANVNDPTSGTPTPAITPGTTISAISGTTVTLSQNAAETGTSLYCAACWWLALGPSFPIGTWITAISLQNAWTVTTTPGFMKDAQGFVHLKGRIASGASGSVAFNLPAGYRPGQNDTYAIAGLAAGGGTAVAAFAAIHTTGDVLPFYASAINDVGFGGVTFLAEN